MQDVDFIIEELKSMAEPSLIQKLGHFGIDVSKALGIRVPQLRQLAKQIGKNQELSLLLWKKDIHEAKLLATFIGDYKQVTEQQIDNWVHDFYSWDICDQACG